MIEQFVKTKIMLIAIHHTKGSFSEQWIDYCKLNSIAFIIVNCYKNNIVEQLNDCNALFWHFHHSHHMDILFAKQLLFSIENTGIKVFPNFNTSWHFNDKIAQKYLFESLRIASVPTTIFYNKKDAIKWAKTANYPKVFKLRIGAGSLNVRLVSNSSSAIKLINKAFDKGFHPYPPMEVLRRAIRNFDFKKSDFISLLKGTIKFIRPSNFTRISGREKGYVYFQDFVAGNLYDIRVIIISGKAISIKRLVPKNDFRASGSGLVESLNEKLPTVILKMAFEAYKKLKAQSVAFDFLSNDNNDLFITEISYGFDLNVYNNCNGYWNEDLQWTYGEVDLCGWQIKSILQNEKV